MKKNELIEALQAIEGNPEVCILDWKTNLNADSGDGSNEGVHHFVIELQGPDDIPNGQEPWVALSFDNPDIDIHTGDEEDEEEDYPDPEMNDNKEGL